MTQVFHEIPWNIPWNSMELWCRQMKYHLVPWNSRVCVCTGEHFKSDLDIFRFDSMSAKPRDVTPMCFAWTCKLTPNYQTEVCLHPTTKVPCIRGLMVSLDPYRGISMTTIQYYCAIVRFLWFINLFNEGCFTITTTIVLQPYIELNKPWVKWYFRTKFWLHIHHAISRSNEQNILNMIPKHIYQFINRDYPAPVGKLSMGMKPI